MNSIPHGPVGLNGSAEDITPRECPLWDTVEITFRVPSDGNPFVDVTIDAEFSCGARHLSVAGFYDGDQTYRIRCMPDVMGEWTYELHSSLAAIDGQYGRFLCTERREGVHGPVRVAHTYHFAYADGTRYLPIGTTCYAWTHQGDELEENTLSSLRDSPFNKLRMCVFPKFYDFNRNEPPCYPFEGSLEAGWDFERFNTAFFRHLEDRVRDLMELGIEADIILFHPYDRWGFARMSKEADDRYLRYILARLSAFRNVWWSLANEYDLLEEMLKSKEASDWERFAQIITREDPWNHLRSVHNCFRLYDHSKSWITHSSIQRIDVYRTSENTNEWRDRFNKPVVIDECGYEGNISLGWGNLPPQELVRRFWEGAVRGGYVGHGETYMDPHDVLWWSKGGRLRGESPARIRFLRAILEDSPDVGLTPVSFGWESWDLPCGAVAGEYYLFYFGFNQPLFRSFNMPEGLRLEISLIDTWAMTIEQLAGTYEGSFRIDLPGRPYIAVRMRRAD